MKLICSANSDNEHYQPAYYAVLYLTPELARLYLQRIWDYHRIREQDGHGTLFEMTYFEGMVEYLVPYYLDDKPQFASLVETRAKYDLGDFTEMLNMEGEWHRLPEAMTFENTQEPPDEDVVLYTEGDRLEIWRTEVYFHARPKHGDTKLSPRGSLTVIQLQQVVTGEIGKTDPCIICLWDDRTQGDLCDECHADGQHLKSLA